MTLAHVEVAEFSIQQVAELRMVSWTSRSVQLTASALLVSKFIKPVSSSTNLGMGP